MLRSSFLLFSLGIPFLIIKEDFVTQVFFFLLKREKIFFPWGFVVFQFIFWFLHSDCTVHTHYHRLHVSTTPKAIYISPPHKRALFSLLVILFVFLFPLFPPYSSFLRHDTYPQHQPSTPLTKACCISMSVNPESW